MDKIVKVDTHMDAKIIGKMINDGHVVEIIMRELHIDRAKAVRLWYGSDTRIRLYEVYADKLKIEAKLCYEELMKERGESNEENTHCR